jgi:aryl-alcohol dehydrogenase-like predicted oxidoreductase
MEYARLGGTGLNVSRIALGCMSYGENRGLHAWTLDEESSQPFFRQAVELGVTFWDTANVYQPYSTQDPYWW